LGEKNHQGELFLRILLADESEMTRFALAALLEQRPGWIVVGEVVSAQKLLPEVEATSPDLVLLSWSLPNLRIEETIPTMTTNFPGISVIVLSGRPEARPQAMAAGAKAFVSKADPPDCLLETVKSIEILTG
jgi:DNA-binding NarL/FixJ family response regulator